MASSSSGPKVRIPDPEKDGLSSSPDSPAMQKARHQGQDSWDVLGGIRKFEDSYNRFDSRRAQETHLVYADGDLPKNKFAKLYNYLINVSIVTRWILFIVPVLIILWIPGILGLTHFKGAAVWGVGLLWWSIWLSILWGGWWAALAFSRIAPVVLKSTIGVIALSARRYIDWFAAIHRYVALFSWSLANFISYHPLIDGRQRETASQKSKDAIDLIGRLVFGTLLCTAILLFEKFAIQYIAGKFHERSYAERIAEQKTAVRYLVNLYRHSVDIPGRTDTLEDSGSSKRSTMNPTRFLKKIRHGVRLAATTTTTAFGNVASEIAGSSVLQPNSPQAMVKTALESANKSRLLARRLFYSFAKPGADFILLEDFVPYFPDKDEAEKAFTLFDKDGNGDASREEVEIACLEFHREQLSIENSMHDLDSAVGRLDNIFMTLYIVVITIIFAVVLQAQLVALITGAGTLILGLSWLIGGSLQEVLTSIIFLFVKHPFDVGDRVVVQGNGTLVQAPNLVLNGQFILNYRRSPQMSETFTFDVGFSTSFDDIENLRQKMLQFVQAERRDYQPAFDVSIVDFPGQEKMTLSTDIKYKSNHQIGALKSKRRNKWICALKTSLSELKIYGPGGDPGAAPGVARYTQIPWETIQMRDREAAKPVSMPVPTGGWELSDKNAVLHDDSQDVFGEADELHMTSPRRGLSGSQGRPTATISMPMPATMPARSAGEMMESIELRRR